MMPMSGLLFFRKNADAKEEKLSQILSSFLYIHSTIAYTITFLSFSDTILAKNPQKQKHFHYIQMFFPARATSPQKPIWYMSSSNKGDLLTGSTMT